MITRRTALTMLPAGLLAGSSYFSLARAQTPQKTAINPIPDASRIILGQIEKWKGSPHHDATKALIEALDRIASLRGAPFSTERRRNSKSELTEALAIVNATYTPVSTVINSRKKTDDIIERDDVRKIAPTKRTEASETIIERRANINSVLAELFKGSGDFDVNRIRNSKEGAAAINSLISNTEELLGWSVTLSQWGPDAFYAAVRGYVTFQFVRDRIRVGRTSPLLARSFMFRIIGESESYFSLKMASLNAPPTPQVTSSVSGAPAVAGITANERYKVERDLIEKSFPREFYLGSELGQCRGDPRSVVNHYGKLKGSFDSPRGFELDGVDGGLSKSECTTQINDRRLGAINGLLGQRFRTLGPSTGGGENYYKQTLDEVRDALNDLVERLKRQKKREDETNPSQQQPDTGAQNPADKDAQLEFTAMQAMTKALREMLSSS